MSDNMPPELRDGTRARVPVVPAGYSELLAEVAQERALTSLAELDRETGRITLDQPDPPDVRFPRGLPPLLHPDPHAFGGTAEIVRSGFVAKYDPNHRDRGTDFSATDPCWEFPWRRPKEALDGPWVRPRHKGLQRSFDAGSVLHGDLVFLFRTGGRRPNEGKSHTWLNRKTIVGLCWAESVLTDDPDGGGPAITLFPIRLFNFPVPIKQTGQQDSSFEAVYAFRDRARLGFLELSPHELLTVTRDCGLPVDILTEPDPNLLAPLGQGLDLGPPDVVRRRILEGARAQDHRDRVERRAVTHVVRRLRSRRWGVADTQKIRGAEGPGADLWVNAEDKKDGNASSHRIEVKGTAGSKPWGVRLTKNEREAARRAIQGGDSWWLVVVTDVLHDKPAETWFSASSTLAVFSIADRSGEVFSADRGAANRL